MTAIEFERADAMALAKNASHSLVARVDTVTKLTELEACWRMLETSGVVTPYQTFDWLSAWVDTMAESLGVEPLIVVMRDQRGRILALLPLCIHAKGGLRIARFLGGKSANMNFPVLERAASAALSAREIDAALELVADQHGIDLYHLESQPLVWDGHRNPLLTLVHQKSASSAWKTKLSTDPEAMVKGMMSSESRKKLRHKEKKLGEFGEISYRTPHDVKEAEEVLDVFLKQKAQRFQTLGIADPFASSAIKNFLHRGVTDGLAEGRPTIILRAMRAGDRILSVFGGAIHQDRYTGMFTSFDMDPLVSKFSPGDLLLLNLMRDMSARGIGFFDLGTGDAAYKNDYCQTEEPLADSFLAFTLRGSAAALVLTNAMKAKRRLKKSPTIVGLVSRFRKLKRG